MTTSAVAVIVNPISGGGAGRAGACLERVDQLLAGRQAVSRVHVTERAGHARELAREAVRDGIRTVVAWGGDGTVNEVAAALVGSPVQLAIVPTGSGNGLARGLGLPTRIEEALDVAFAGRVRLIDTGEVDGAPFMNVAGIGVDAHIARRFAEAGGRRGLRTYVSVTARELLRYRAREYEIVTDTSTIRVRALLIAMANGREYGNGAIIAPDAQLDDGQLDLVVVKERPLVRTLCQLPALFGGRAHQLPGVQTIRTARAEVRAGEEIPYHVDGEPRMGGVTLQVRLRPASLRVMVPEGA